MDFLNETRYPAQLFRTVIDRERIAAAVVARVSFDIAGGALRPAADQPWTVSAEPWDSPVGVPMEGDVPFRKDGVDVHLFGTAHAPGGRPAGSFEVRVEAGDLVRRALVWGPRTWTARAGDLVASVPEPIVSLPLTIDNAYGGEAEFDGLAVGFPDNPRGKGFYIEREQAQSGALPQIEDAGALVKQWSDRPVPAGFGFCPYPSATRLLAAAVVEDNQIKEITHRLFNTAYPRMIARELPPGARVRITGMTPGDPIEFTVPRIPLFARVKLADRIAERPLTLDQIGVEADARRVFIGLRFPFRYVTHPEELREATLFEKAM